ncbi:MAG TPA: carbon storage regulator [Gemmataceae bacterium]|jgi:carbon storage regulator CsrA|nr:carbon storage regulator [Gemmataceae bacterium]
MLVLSRRLNQKILLPGVHTSVRVVAIKRGVVRLGIEAPPSVTVLREEVQDRTAEWQPTAAQSGEANTGAESRHPGHLLRDGLKAASLSLGMARLQLRLGQTGEVRETLDKIHAELQRLRRGLEGGKEKAVPAPTPQPDNEPRTSNNHAACELLAGCAG